MIPKQLSFLDELEYDKAKNEQPKPRKNDYPAVWDLVIKDMQERDRIGLEHYGTRLQPFNGRNNLRDLMDELLDAVVYIRALIYEIEGK